MKTASWIIRTRKTKEVLFETFSQNVVNSLNNSKYEAVPIYDYLTELNARIRAAGCVA